MFNNVIRVSAALLLAIGSFTAPAAMIIEKSGTSIAPRSDAPIEGVLENGLRFAVKRSEATPGKAMIFLKVEVGSDSVPYADIEIPHLLEHVLVSYYSDQNGNRQQVADYLKWLGVPQTFYAGTNPDDTTYSLTVDAGKVHDGLALMRQVAQGSRFTAREAETHRGVVLAEIDQSDDADPLKLRYRALGIWDSRSATKQDRARSLDSAYSAIRSLYEKWYVPGAQTLVVVGDLEPEAVVQVLKSNFGTMRGTHTGSVNLYPNSDRDIDYNFLQVRRCCTESVYMETRFLYGESDGVDYRPSLADDIALELLSGRLYELRGVAGLPFKNFMPGAPELNEAHALRGDKRLDGFRISATSAPDDIGYARTFFDAIVRSVDRAYINAKLPGIKARRRQASEDVPSSLMDEAVRLIARFEVQASLFPAGTELDDIDATVIEAAIRRWLSGRQQVTIWSKQPMSEERFAKQPLSSEVRRWAIDGETSARSQVVDTGKRPAEGEAPSEEQMAAATGDQKTGDGTLSQALVVQSDPAAAFVELTLVNMSGIAAEMACGQRQRRFVEYMFNASGSNGQSGYELKKFLSASGMSLSISIGAERSHIAIAGPSERLSVMVRILSDYAFRPKLLDSTYEDAKKYHLYYSSQREKRTDLADEAIAQFIAYGRVKAPQCVDFVSKADAVRIWRSLFGPGSGAKLLAAGSVRDMDALQAMAKSLSGGRTDKARGGPAKDEATPASTSAELEVREESKEAEYDVVATVRLEASLRDRPAVRALSAILAKRISAKLREEDGTTYTPAAWARYDRRSGKLIMQTRFRPRVGARDRAIAAAKAVITNLLAEGVSPSEAITVSRAVPRTSEVGHQVLADKLEYGWKPGEPEAFPTSLEVEAVNAVLNRCGQATFLTIG